MNNFKEYEKRLVTVRGPHKERIKQNLTETPNTVGFSSELVDRYISRVFDEPSIIPVDQDPLEEETTYPSEE